MSGPYMIEMQQACKAYRTIEGSRVVLDDVSLAIPRGHSVGVLGANGAGKSTLVRLLAGVEALDRGRIRRGGTVSFPLGFSGTLHPHLSGRENVRFLARVHGTDEAETLDYVERFAELGEYFRMKVETYSSGMLARLAFGACLAIEFDLYLIDEVTAVGDAQFRRKCLAAFEERMDRSDVILVSHDDSTMRAYCDMGAVLADGRLDVFEELEAAMEVHAWRMRRAASPALRPA
jgi:capsular polysaccharide transport system ATP-binding protein